VSKKKKSAPPEPVKEPEPKPIPVDLVPKKEYELLALRRQQEYTEYAKRAMKLERRISDLSTELRELRESMSAKSQEKLPAPEPAFGGLASLELTADDIFLSAERVREVFSSVDSDTKVILFSTPEVLDAIQGKEVVDE